MATTTIITELSLPEALKRHGITKMIKNCSKITITFVNGSSIEQINFKDYGSDISKTLQSFQENIEGRGISKETESALTIYLSDLADQESLKNTNIIATNDDEEEQPQRQQQNKKEVYLQKFSNGILAEAAVVAAQPCFLVSDKDGNISVMEQIEVADKIIKPLEPSMYLNKPYIFKSREELDAYIEKAKNQTIDALFYKIVSICQKYIDADEFHIFILAADIIYTYYQDNMGLTHYLFFVGNNSSGKSNNLKVIHMLAYRNMKSTDITPANIYRFLGSEEEGQGTFCHDEADDLDQNDQLMRIYKEGYTKGGKVMRTDSTNYSIKQYAFNTFCFKAFAAERLPDSRRAKGFKDRCIEIPCYYGSPEYDISEVINPAGVGEYQNLLDELEETRNTLLIYRMLHWHEQIPQVKLNIDGREKQLFGPLIRVFQGSTALKQILPVINKCVTQKRESHANSFHALLYQIIRDLIKQEDKTELSSERIWQELTKRLRGEFPHNKPLSYESGEYGTISQKVVTDTLTQIFGAKQSKNRRDGRKLVFDKEKLDRLGRIFEREIEIKVGTQHQQQSLVTDVKDVTDIGIGRYLNNPNHDTAEDTNAIDYDDDDNNNDNKKEDSAFKCNNNTTTTIEQGQEVNDDNDKDNNSSSISYEDKNELDASSNNPSQGSHPSPPQSPPPTTITSGEKQVYDP